MRPSEAGGGDLLRPGVVVTIDTDLARKYFLGALSDNDRVRVEDECFSDVECFEEFTAAENDLIDSYVRDGLSDSERRQFELQYMTSPERRQRVDFARTLSEFGLQSKKPAFRKSVFGWWSPSPIAASRFVSPQLALTAAGFSVVLVGGFFLLRQNRSLQIELRQAQKVTGEIQRRQDALSQQIAALNKPESESAREAEKESIAKAEPAAFPGEVLSLQPGILRAGGNTPTLRLPLRGVTVELKLYFEGDRPGPFEAVVQTAEQKTGENGNEGELFHKTLPRPVRNASGEFVVLEVPVTSVQSAGQYVVTLFDVQSKEDLESYVFSVAHR